MHAAFSCQRGHAWELSVNSAPPPTSWYLTCPVCGLTVAAPEAAQQDTATVPPRSVPESTAAEEALEPELLPEDDANDRPAVPGYEILGELGRGGMGVVYKARHLALKRIVALKMILAGGHAGDEELRRFRTEAEAVARLQHVNIVQIYEVGERNGLPYFSLEYADGGNLARKLEGTPLPPRQAAQLTETLARAIDHAHQRGIVHRDLKPANVLLAGDADVPLERCTPKITDFGLAKRLDVVTGQTQSGAIMGTPSYMAPEQAGGKSKQIGPTADVYALGAILYEFLSGRPPFRAATMLDTVLQVLSEEPVPPRRLNSRVPRDLETICLKCLHKEPAKRYASAADLADDLRRFLSGEAIRARPPGFLGATLKKARKQPLYALLVILICAAIIFGVVQQIRALKVMEDASALWEMRGVWLPQPTEPLKPPAGR